MPSEALSNLAKIGKIKAEPMNRVRISRHREQHFTKA